MEAPPLLQLGIKQLNQSALNEFNLQLGSNLSAIFNKLNLHNNNNKLDSFMLPIYFT